MKRYIENNSYKKFVLIALLFIFSCNSENTGEKTVDNSADQTLHREGRALMCGGTEFTIKAVNFDNLTWYSPEDGDYSENIYRLHHDETDYKKVNSLGFNAVRFFIRWQDLYEDAQTLKRRDDGWQWIHDNIEWAATNDVGIILDFHGQPGGFGEPCTGTWPIWTDSESSDSFIAMWGEIAREFNGEKTILAYDVMNEPSLPHNGEIIYGNLMNDVVKEIRIHDREKLIIVEAITGIEGDADSYLTPTWVKVDDENVLYSFHFYEPIWFTHNGENGVSETVSFPDQSTTVASLEQSFLDSIEDPVSWGYPVFLGEFGCNDWRANSGSSEWITSLFSFCKKYRVHPALFCYRSFVSDSESDFGFSIYTKLSNTDGSSAEMKNENLISVITNSLKDFWFADCSD